MNKIFNLSTFSNKWDNILFWTLIICISTFSFFSYWNLIESRDAAVYMYVGKLLNQGKLPYKDIWDHKTPGIYFYYAFLYSFCFNIKHLSLILLNFYFIINCILFYKILKKYFTTNTSKISVLIFSIFYFWLLGKEGPFLIENYAVILQTLAIFAFLNFDKNNNLFFVGLIGGISLLFKPTIISLWIGIYLTFFHQLIINKNYKRLFVKLLITSIGFLLPIFLSILFFSKNNALSYAYDEIIKYNSIYISNKFNLINFINSSANVFFTNFLTLSIWIYFSFNKRKIFLYYKNFKLFFIIYFSYPFEFYFSHLSGYSYAHYFFSGIIINIILILFFLKFCHKSFFSSIWIKFNSFAILFIIVFYNVCFRIPKIININNTNNELIFYLNRNSFDNNYCLIYGNETSIYLNTNFYPVSKFTYQYPLYKVGYQSVNMWNEFINDFTKIKPSVFVDTYNPEMVNNYIYNGTNYSKIITNLLDNDYYKVKEIGSYTIYKRKNK